MLISVFNMVTAVARTTGNFFGLRQSCSALRKILLLGKVYPRVTVACFNARHHVYFKFRLPSPKTTLTILAINQTIRVRGQRTLDKEQDTEMRLRKWRFTIFFHVNQRQLNDKR